MTDDQMFSPAWNSPKHGHADLPLRERNLLSDLCARFGPDRDGFELFINPEASTTLRRSTLEQAPSETLGLLVGRSYRDQQGSYTVVTGVLVAPAAVASAGSVQVDGDQMRALQREAERRHPTQDLCGWFHSHPNHGHLSHADLAEQRTWPKDHHVGVLTFMRPGDPWACAFRGPNASKLPMTAPGAPSAELQGMPTMEAPPLGRRMRAAALPERWRRLLITTAVLALVLAAAAGAWRISARLSSRFAAVDRRLDRLSTQAVQPPANLLDWSCKVLTPGSVRCAGPVGLGITGWSWDFGDGSTGTGPAVTHHYLRQGDFSVSLVVLTPTGSHDAGAVPVQATPPRNRRGGR